MIMIITTLLEG